MKTSLIITTYNWKEALDLTLKSVARQTEMPDEILIADDGSRQDTGELVSSWTKNFPVPVRHIWQEDCGFRLARSRNNAIAAANGDYIIIIDGDMIVNKYFIHDHKKAAKPGYFIQGVRVLTGPHATKKILSNQILDIGFLTKDIERRRHILRNSFLSWILYQQVHKNQKAIRGSNQAYWKADLLLVNGFNEMMVGWGKEDNEIAERLYNAGINRKNLKFSALATHLHHNIRSRTGENPNDVHMQETINKKLTRCKLGLDQHINNPQKIPFG